MRLSQQLEPIMTSYKNKKYLLLIAISFAVAATSILATAMYYRNILRDHIINIELPLRFQELINILDKDILEATKALNIPAKAPTLQTWIAHGEPNTDNFNIYPLLDNLHTTYKLDTVNFASHQTNQYTLLSRGSDKLDYTHTFNPKDDWYVDFQERTKSGNFDSTLVVYVNDPLWGYQAYINKRVEHNGEFAGLLSISVDIRNLATKLIENILGEEGSTFCVNSYGIICLHRDIHQIHKHITDVYPQYEAIFPKILANTHHYDEYESNLKGTIDTRYTFSEKIPLLDLIIITESSEHEFLKKYTPAMYVTYGVAGFFFLITLIFFYLYIRVTLKYRD